MPGMPQRRNDTTMHILTTLVTEGWLLIAIGIAAGILSGLLGVGSGILVVPILVLAFQYTQKSAQGTALAVMIPMALVGAIRYGMNPAIETDISRILLLGLGAVGGAFIGTYLAARIPNEVLRRLFAVFLLIVAVRMLLPNSNNKGKHSGQKAVAAAPENAGGEGGG